MAESGKIVTWNNFKGGDYGDFGGSKPPPGTFHAKNMLVYTDGSIGPRAGLKNITPASMPNGALLALASTSTPNRELFFLIGTTGYYAKVTDPGVVPIAYSGTLDDTPDQPVKPKHDTATLLFTVRQDDSTPDKVYRVDPVAGTIAGIPGSAGGIDVVLQGQQLIVATSEFSNQILGSSPDDPTDWSAGIFADVDDNWQVTALHVVRNTLAIIKRTGWVVMTGVLGDFTSQVFRKVSSADGVLHSWHCEIDANDNVWFWPLFRQSPAVFNGQTIQYFGQINRPIRVDDATIATTPLNRGVTVVNGKLTPSTTVLVQGGDDNGGAIFANNQWTLHDFETPISGMVTSNGNQFLITDGGSDSAPAQIYSTFFDLDRPAFVGEGLVSPGDNSDTPVDALITFPQFWSPNGREFTVRQIMVSFTSYDTGNTATNHFGLDLTVMGRGRGKGYQMVQAISQEFDQTPSESSNTGTDQEWYFNVHCDAGSGIEVTLKDIRGVKIRAVSVLSPDRSWEPEA